MKFEKLIYCGLMILSALLFLAAAPPRNVLVLQWFSLVPFLFVISRLSPRASALYGWLFGFLVNTGIHYWMVYTLQEFGRIPPLFGVPILILFASATGLQFALVGLLFSWLRLRPLSGTSTFLQMKATLGAASLFTTIEFIFPQLFPWYFGAIQSAHIPLVQVADITGIHGITFIAVLVNMALWLVLEARLQKTSPPLFGLSLAAVSMSIALIYGYWKIADYEKNPPQETLAVGMVQPNLGNMEKLYSSYGYERTRSVVRDKFTALTRSVKTSGFHPDLIVLPETTVPGFFFKDKFMRQHMFDLAQEAQSSILFGGYHEEGPKIYNTAFLISPSYQVLGFYNKIYLLAFGEYMPLSELFPILKAWFPAAGDFNRGEDLSPLVMENGTRITPLICYEVIVPRFVRRFIRKGSEIIVNITNDSWFGNTDEPHQHLALSAIRSIEHRRAMVRVTNTGISAVIDPLGRILEKSDVFDAEVLRVKVPVMRSYSWYSQHGDVFAIITAILSLSLVIITAMDRGRKRKR